MSDDERYYQEAEEAEEGQDEIQLTHYLSDDEISKSLIAKIFPQLLPLDSRLHSLTYVDKHEVKALKYRINALVGLIEASMDESRFSQEDHLLLLSIGEHLKLRLNDSLRGRKLKALTEHVRIIETRSGERRGFGFLGGKS